jgi:hypothetical protein
MPFKKKSRTVMTKRIGKGVSKYGGWSNEGIKSFNDLYDLVENKRKEPWAKKVEDRNNKKTIE